VGDLDGDGEYEIILKWDPTNSEDNSLAGFTGNVYLDAYKLDGTQLWRIDLGMNIRAGAHYTQFMVYDYDGDGIAEVVCKTAPGTIDGAGKYVIMNSDSPTADYRNHTTNTTGANRMGTITTGPEYLTLFDGRTGKELNTVAYNPPRGDVNAWGDNYGNRSDRFLACVAYLDGVHPSAVMCRGYYTRACLAAYDVKDKKLVQRWFYDSGSTSGVGAYGQGNHNLSVADVNGDGKDEIIYGACAINNDGTLLYRTGLGHGDAMHLSKLDPDRTGLQVWDVHEEAASTYRWEMHDAGTGSIIWGGSTTGDNGRGCAADIDAKYRGFEMWSSLSTGTYSCKGTQISTSKPSADNFRIYWDGDLQDELLDGVKISKWTGSGTTTLLTCSGVTSCNSTKATPNLSADLFGDWREELVLCMILFTGWVLHGKIRHITNLLIWDFI
jgi:rhamnogalacturonan endolyase